MVLVRKLVVAGLVGRGDGAILLTRRRADQALAGYWELPGGKVEPGEPPAGALARELREELAVDAVVGRVWDVVHHVYDGYEVVLLVYAAALRDGARPRAVEVAEWRWVPPAELADYRVLPADEPLVDRLRREGVPPLPVI